MGITYDFSAFFELSDGGLDRVHGSLCRVVAPRIDEVAVPKRFANIDVERSQPRWKLILCCLESKPLP